MGQQANKVRPAAQKSCFERKAMVWVIIRLCFRSVVVSDLSIQCSISVTRLCSLGVAQLCFGRRGTTFSDPALHQIWLVRKLRNKCANNEQTDS